jgi:transposase-like protein
MIIRKGREPFHTTLFFSLHAGEFSMTQTVRFSIEMPKCPSCEKFIETSLKHNVISKVNVSRSYSGGTVECTYDDKVHSTVDKYKLERELKDLVKNLGYKVT